MTSLKRAVRILNWMLAGQQLLLQWPCSSCIFGAEPRGEIHGQKLDQQLTSPLTYPRGT